MWKKKLRTLTMDTTKTTELDMNSSEVVRVVLKESLTMKIVEAHSCLEQESETFHIVRGDLYTHTVDDEFGSDKYQ